MAYQVDVLIVGAGLSGILAGQTLAEAGLRVLLVDKGRSVGGRMATRRIGAGLADHGAQFFTVRESKFRALVDQWLEKGIVFEWSRGWSDGSLVNTRDGHPRYAVRDGMNALPKYLAQGLESQLSTRVIAIRKFPDSWQIEEDSGKEHRARAVLLTAPVPQSLAILKAGDVHLPAEHQQALDAIQYQPCITLMYELEGEVSLPTPGALQRPHANISWLADNQRKGISSTQIITAQASGDYSHRLWDMTDDEIIRTVRVDLMPFFGEEVNVLSVQVKRWRYSVSTSLYPERFLLLPETRPNGTVAPLVFAGDAFGGPRVEGAVLSGLAAGEAIAAALK